MFAFVPLEHIHVHFEFLEHAYIYSFELFNKFFSKSVPLRNFIVVSVTFGSNTLFKYFCCFFYIKILHLNILLVEFHLFIYSFLLKFPFFLEENLSILSIFWVECCGPLYSLGCLLYRFA